MRQVSLSIALVLVIAVAVRAAADVFTVTTASDLCGVDGFCSLREAIVAGNTVPTADCPAGLAPGMDRIHFAIPGAGPRTITPSGSDLPALTTLVFIDRLTQPANGAPTASCLDGPLLIELVGSSVNADNGRRAP
jgi:CSLREA domain-containing protein